MYFRQPNAVIQKDASECFAKCSVKHLTFISQVREKNMNVAILYTWLIIKMFESNHQNFFLSINYDKIDQSNLQQ